MDLMNEVNQIDEKMTQDLMVIKTISPYQPQLLII